MPREIQRLSRVQRYQEPRLSQLGLREIQEGAKNNKGSIGAPLTSKSCKSQIPSCYCCNFPVSPCTHQNVVETLFKHACTCRLSQELECQALGKK